MNKTDFSKMELPHTPSPAEFNLLGGAAITARESGEKEEQPSDVETLKAENETLKEELKRVSWERRSKHVQVLMTPSLYEALKEEAKKAGKSVNEVINKILDFHFDPEQRRAGGPYSSIEEE